MPMKEFKRDEPVHWKSLVNGNTYPWKYFHNISSVKYNGNKRFMCEQHPLPFHEYPFTLIYESDLDKDYELKKFMIRVEKASSEHLMPIGFGVIDSTYKEIDEFDISLAKASSNWMIGPVAAYLNDNNLHISEFPIPASDLRELICYVEFTDLITFSSAREVMLEMIKTGERAWDVMERLKLIQSSDTDEIEKTALTILEKYPEKVAEYKKGKVTLIGMFVGETIKASSVKPNPKAVNEVIKKLLEK